MPQFNLTNPASGGTFGSQVVVLSTGNIVVTDPTVNNNAGAVYLYDGASGALISTLSGNAGDQLGSGGLTVLTNGNYVVADPAHSQRDDRFGTDLRSPRWKRWKIARYCRRCRNSTSPIRQAAARLAGRWRSTPSAISL